jgi:hypothetical protein
MVASVFQEDKKPKEDAQCDVLSWGAHLVLIVRYVKCVRDSTAICTPVRGTWKGKWLA